jgi:O-antigen/teichoic acid export membrane protein
VKPGSLVRSTVVGRNAVLNLMGAVIPAMIAVPTVPFISQRFGVDRFGILSLIWVLLSYFSYFDFGLGRATTQFIAARLGQGATGEIPAVLWTSLALQLGIGLTGGVLLAISTTLVVGPLVSVPSDLVTEAQTAFRLIAMAVPFLGCQASLRGALEAAQRFDLVNLVRVPYNASLLLLPAVGVIFNWGLVGSVLLLTISIIGTTFAYFFLSLMIFAGLRRGSSIGIRLFQPLFGFGWWATLSNLIVPVLVYGDRLLISVLVSVAALAYYTVPFELAFRLLIFPSSLVATLFPAFSSLAAHHMADVKSLFTRSLKHLLLMTGPLALSVIPLAGPALRIWLGPEFAQQGTLVLQILAIGMLLNAISQVPASLLDGVGRPDLRAKLFLLYGWAYLLLAAALIGEFGIVGAALAWTLRAAVEMALFFIVSWRLLGLSAVAFIESGCVRAVGVTGVLAVVVVAIAATWQAGWLSLTLITAVALATSYWVTWCFVLDQTDRIGLKGIASGIFLFGTRGTG